MSEHEHDDNFELKYVGYVALAIGLVVFLSGMGGLLLNLAHKPCMSVFYIILGLVTGFLIAVVFPWMLLRTLAKEENASEEEK